MNLPRISPEEYARRQDRLRGLMREHGLAAVLLGTGVNLTYFSGYPSPARSGSRPYFLLLPLEGGPIFLVHSGRKFEAERLSVIQDVRAYTALSQVPVEMIRAALGERGALGKRVGMEFGVEQPFDVPYLELRRLQEVLAGTELADAGGLLWQMRFIKSAEEVACLRAACRVLDDAYAATFAAAREGMTEIDIARIMLGHFDAAGAGDRFLVLASGRGNYDLPSKPPGDRRIERGDMVWIDAGCTVAGYWSDYSRAGVVGAPSRQQVEAQEAIQRITWQAVEMVKPGVRASALGRFCDAQVARLPFPITSDISGLAARAGHGIGLALTELPHIAAFDDTVLEPGMAITIEPAVATDYGTFHVEENVLVTEAGHEVLSQAPRELARIGS